MGRTKHSGTRALPCGMCQEFKDIPHKERQYAKKGGTYTEEYRSCPYGGKTTHDSASCARFKLIDTFGCYFYNHTITAAMCVNRQKELTLFYEKCVKCRVGKTLKALVKELGLGRACLFIEGQLLRTTRQYRKKYSRRAEGQMIGLDKSGSIILRTKRRLVSIAEHWLEPVE